MPTIDFSVLAGLLAQTLIELTSTASIALLLYNIGGILIRTLSWSLDGLIINFIDKFYRYFELILKGDILSENVVNELTNRVYLLVGVIVLFRLGMLLVKYILNPSDALDEKRGAHRLAQRVVIGLMLIVLMPTIFNVAKELQVAIIKDQVIERIIMDDSTLKKAQSISARYGNGRVIAMTVFSGFFGLEEGAPADAKLEYENMQKYYDPAYITSILDKQGDNYVYSYFPILSTIVLGYVLYLVIKYCLDVVVRCFKLTVLQVISPIVIVEYMINGDSNEVFKTWRKSCIATYVMLFLRIVTIWFVAFVAVCMQDNTLSSGTLLEGSDFLLKSIIVLGLLAFLMDFPKMISELFGMDLEQDGSVKSVLGKTAGAFAVGGGAALGFAHTVGSSAGRAAKAGTRGMIGNKWQAFGQGKGKALRDADKRGVKKMFGDAGKAMKSSFSNSKGSIGLSLGALGKSVVSSVPGASKAVDGFSSTNKVRDIKSKEAETLKENAAAQKEALRESEVKNLRDVDRVIDSMPRGASETSAAYASRVVETVLNARIANIDIPELTAPISGQISALSASGSPVTVDAVANLVSSNLKANGHSEVTVDEVRNVINNVSTFTGHSVDSFNASDITSVVEGSLKEGMRSGVSKVANEEVALKYPS